MSKFIVFDLGEGDFKTGLSSIRVTLSDANFSLLLQRISSLPPAPQLAQIYEDWYQLYQIFAQSYLTHNRLEILASNQDNYLRFSDIELSNLSKKLSLEFNKWLESQSFLREVINPLYRELNRQDDIQIILQTNNLCLRQFPWNIWTFLHDYPQSEITLSALTFARVQKVNTNHTGKIRVLGVFGNCKNINLQKDHDILKSLQSVNLKLLIEPDRQQLQKYLWDKNGWDILFFAGHSQTREGQGIIYLNDNEQLSIQDIKYALNQAIANGLQLAIFNSCDGIGLANQLEDLHIPQVIVMRYPLPDAVAHEFLKYFLTAFSQGASLPAAIRQGREQLQGLEDKFFCASWLPVLIQNPTTAPSSWKSLQGNTHSWRRGSKPILATSFVSTILIMLLRSWGCLQSLELLGYDYFMRWRPQEGVDTRLLLITITEEDIARQDPQEREKGSLSDRLLEKALIKLEASQATAIGLDVYREQGVKPNHPTLAQLIRNSDRFVNICRYGKSGINPPPEVSPQSQGFSNIELDEDNYLRRSILAVESPQPCQNPYSFSYQLAYRHFYQTHGGELSFPINEDGYVQMGKTIFYPINSPMGGYQHLDDRSHQILINYRQTQNIAETVSLNEFISKYPVSKVGSRVVIIGTVDDSYGDPPKYTPIGILSGVTLQAHLVSQLLSTVLDGRPLIWSWSFYSSTVWVWGWSLVGGILAWKLPSRSLFLLGYGFGSIFLLGNTWIIWLFGGWIPLIPPLLALGMSSGAMRSYRRYF